MLLVLWMKFGMPPKMWPATRMMMFLKRIPRCPSLLSFYLLFCCGPLLHWCQPSWLIQRHGSITGRNRNRIMLSWVNLLGICSLWFSFYQVWDLFRPLRSFNGVWTSTQLRRPNLSASFCLTEELSSLTTWLRRPLSVPPWSWFVFQTSYCTFTNFWQRNQRPKHLISESQSFMNFHLEFIILGWLCCSPWQQFTGTIYDLLTIPCVSKFSTKFSVWLVRWLRRLCWFIYCSSTLMTNTIYTLCTVLRRWYQRAVGKSIRLQLQWPNFQWCFYWFQCQHLCIFVKDLQTGDLLCSLYLCQ